MHGRSKQSTTFRIAIFFLSLVPGCSDALPQAPPVAQPIATAFNPAQAGGIQGRVTWEGEVPVVAPFDYRRNLPSGNAPEPRLVRENPNAPTVDAKTRGVAGAVLYLRGVDAQRARPWDLPPVRVEQEAFVDDVLAVALDVTIDDHRPRMQPITRPDRRKPSPFLAGMEIAKEVRQVPVAIAEDRRMHR